MTQSVAIEKKSDTPLDKVNGISCIMIPWMNQKWNKRKCSGKMNYTKTIQFGFVQVMPSLKSSVKSIAPGMTRTCGTWIRNPLLYPPELRGQGY
jgi:hypothetical protein